MLQRVPYDQLVVAFDWNLPDKLNMAAQVCDDWAARDPDRVAIIDLTDGRCDLSYGEMRSLSDRLALFLTARGVQPGDRVGVLLSQGIWCAISHIAIWKIGAISIP
ncbi:MAG: AMP-binding protein, partial [Pseudomonadota bacterium]